MSWIRKQIERLLVESRRRSRLLKVGTVAALAAVLVVTVALAQGATAASTGGSSESRAGISVEGAYTPSSSGAEGSNSGAAGSSAGEGSGSTTSSTAGADAAQSTNNGFGAAAQLTAAPLANNTTVTLAATNDSNPSKGTLTSATFSTGTTQTSEVAANTRVNFSLSFEFKPDDSEPLSETSNVVTYTLPEGIDVSTSDGAEKDITGATGTQQAGKKLGTFKIENGVVTMTFSNAEEKDLFNETVDTTLTFWGTAQNSSLTNKVTYDFDGKGTLTVDPIEPTLQVSKSVTKQKDATGTNGGDLADGDGNRNRHADYTITVGTTTGTRGTVTIDDSMASNTNVETISYDSKTFTLKKYTSASDTTGTQQSFDPSSLSVTVGQNARFTLSGLSALAAGERYELTYSATVTESDHTADSSATNKVTVKDDGSDVTANGTATANWSNVGDIHITKSGQVLDDVVDASNPKKRRIKYTLLVWSNSGSVTNIQIGDGANDAGSVNIDTSAWNSTDSKNLFFEHGSFHITKYASKLDAQSGTNGTNADTLLKNLSFGADGRKPSLSLTIADPLEAGEAYVLTYTAVVDEADHNAPDTVMNNQAVARIYPGGTAKKTDQQNARVTWHNEIQKTGTFNQTTGNIDWAVTVNRNGGDARGTEMEDTLQQELSSTVRIYQGNTLMKTLDLRSGERSVATEGYDSNPSTYDTTSGLLHVVLGSWATSTGTYTIRFSTKAPADGTVSNSAAVIKNGTTYGSQGINVGVNRVTQWGLAKTEGTNSGAYDPASGVYKMSWNINATFPDQDLTSDSATGVLELHDMFGEVTDENNTTSSQYTGAHYAIAKDLYAELTGASAATTVTLSLHGDTDADGNPKGSYTLDNGTFTRGSGTSRETLTGVEISLTFYDANGNTIESPSTSEDHVKSFKLVLRRTDGNTLNGQALVVTNYHSVVDGSNLPANTPLKVGNSLSSNRTSGSTPSTGSFTTLSNPMEKQVRTLDNRSDNDDKQFSAKDKFEKDWDSTASGDYGTMSGKQYAAQFRIALNTVNYPDNAKVTITDTLPTGMELALTTEGTRHPIRLVQGTGVGTSGADYKSLDTLDATTGMTGKYLSYSTSTENGRQVVTFTFTLSNSLPKGQYYITYTASYKGDSAWGYASTTQRSYTNTATATIGGKDYTSSSTLNVTREAAPVTKYAYGTTTNDRKASYRVVINPAGQDLDANSDTITVADELTGLNLTTMNPELDLSSIHLYRYSDTGTDNLGAELDTSRYSVRYEHDTSRKMTITVPDSTALVLVYTYEFKPGTASDWGSQVSGSTDYGTTIGNTASFGGSSSSSVSQSIRRSTAGGTAYTRTLYLYKVDKDNYANTLTGSRFALHKWDSGTSSWAEVSAGIDGGTDVNGTYQPQQITLATTATNSISAHDVIYAFVETQAPEGYGKTVRYVVWLGENETEDAAWTRIASSTNGTAAASKLDTEGNAVSGTNVARSDVTFVPYQGGSVYVEDERTGVTVTKNWSASDGTPLSSTNSDLPASVRLQLKQSNDNGANWTDYGSAVTISKPTSDSNVWQHTWENLPQADAGGHTYLYKVEEVDASGSWKATYLNNGGISKGNITITNTRQYSLPQTGGVPVTAVLGVGAALVASAAIVLAIRRVAR